MSYIDPCHGNRPRSRENPIRCYKLSRWDAADAMYRFLRLGGQSAIAFERGLGLELGRDIELGIAHGLESVRGLARSIGLGRLGRLVGLGRCVNAPTPSALTEVRS